MSELVAKIQQIGSAHDAFTGRAEKKIDAIERTSASLLDRLENLEARASQPGKTDMVNSEQREHVKLFEDWLRKPKHHEANRKLSEFEMNSKAVSVASAAGGGYAVPEEIGRDIAAFQLKLSPVRNLVRVSRAGTSDIKRLLDLGGCESGWRSESGSVTETNTPQLREIVPTGGEMWAYPKASNWSLEDVMFDVAGWLTESVAKAFAKQEGAAVVSGNGSDKPTGMLNTTPVTTSDEASPKRAAAAYMYLLGADNSPASIDADTLIDMVYSLNSAYRSGASWIMNSTTAGQLRKLKDNTNSYLWSPSLQAGQPSMLLGYPVYTLEDLPDPTGGAYPLAFGNFMEAYELIDRSDLRITFDEISAPGYSRWYIRKRVYGHVRDNNAARFLKLL